MKLPQGLVVLTCRIKPKTDIANAPGVERIERRPASKFREAFLVSPYFLQEFAKQTVSQGIIDSCSTRGQSQS
ncbi:MAG TPA: hypothetical protein VFF50_04125 [Candidatus Deferrimicrobiaceae bacterium]|nr:hypothetical protein [Candidatus Deferrimicrobiaceae bacterium]